MPNPHTIPLQPFSVSHDHLSIRADLAARFMQGLLANPGINVQHARNALQWKNLFTDCADLGIQAADTLISQLNQGTKQ